MLHQMQSGHTPLQFGIRENIQQVAHQLVQVFMVGLTLGMMRTVIPALAEQEFGVPRGSFMLLTAFVVAFGFVKGILNFVAGRWSERIGRKSVLLLGWAAAIPIPFMILYAPNWDWIVAATILLGVNQGFTWSMTQTAKLDITLANQRGFTLGLNEFSGYVGVALAGILTGYLAMMWGPRMGLFVFGVVVIGVATVMTAFWVRETLAWAHAPHKSQSNIANGLPRYPKNIVDTPNTWEIFTLMSWRDRRMASFCQAGLVEKFVDALVWVVLPVYFYQRNVALTEIGWIVGIYGFVWGGAQFFTGRLSDHIGRKKPIVGGMWLCGSGVAMTLLGNGVVWWSLSAAITGLGMALLYPNLSAAVADIAHPQWRGSAIGIYRFWRDLGYGIGALMLGAIAGWTGLLENAIWLTAIAMGLSGAVVWYWGEETHPLIHPADKTPS
ncbi:MAG: MFS transporter [Gammaproteobacteria bacterium]|nr:MFS transporter [Gammaproteobacteria bacterium]